MPFSPIAPLSDAERQTLKYSYPGEFGRGIFAALCTEFAVLVAASHFGVTNPNIIGLLAAAPFFGMLAAVLSATQTSHHRKKSIILSIELVSRATALVAAFTPSGLSFALIMGLSIAVGSMGVPLVSGIYGENFDKVIRGRAVGRLQAVRVATTATFAGLAGAILSYDTAAFRHLLIAVALTSMLCSLFAYRLPEERPSANGNRLDLLRGVFQVLRRDRAYLYLQFIWFIIGFCNLWLMPLRVLRLIDIGFDNFHVMLATAVILNGTQVLMLRFWGSILYRLNFALYRILVGCFFVVGIPIFFYGATFPIVCFGAFVWGSGLAGGSLSWRLVGTFFAPPERLPTYMSIHTFLCGIRGLIGPYLALQMAQAFTYQTVANISVGGNVLSMVLLVPLIYIMRRRTAHLEALDTENEQ